MADRGWLRTKRTKDGAMELWARGWRLEHRGLPLLPMMLGFGFLLASAPIAIRVAGCLALLGVALVCQRLTRLGIRITSNAITVVTLRSSHWVLWDDFIGFVGERSSHDGRCVLVRKSGGQVPLSGALAGEELNPYGEEGDLSMIDELNLAVARFRRELSGDGKAPVPPGSPGARRLSAAG